MTIETPLEFWDIPLVRAMFKDVPAGNREYWLQRARKRVFRRGEAVFHRGEPPRSFHIIISGRAKLTVASDEGDELLLGLRCAGDCLGEVAVIDGGPYPETAIAVEDCTTTISWSRDEMLALMEESSVAVMSLIRTLTERVRRGNQRLESHYLHNLDARMARCLLELAEDHGSPVADGIVVEFPLTQSELAAMVGATRVRVNLLLGQYQDAGLLRLGKGILTILQPYELKKRARL